MLVSNSVQFWELGLLARLWRISVPSIEKAGVYWSNDPAGNVGF
jgi:hypothetical protein